MRRSVPGFNPRVVVTLLWGKVWERQTRSKRSLRTKNPLLRHGRVGQRLVQVFQQVGWVAPNGADAGGPQFRLRVAAAEQAEAAHPGPVGGLRVIRRVAHEQALLG